MGRTRKHTDPLRPLPQGLYLHKNGAYRAKRLGGGYQYFGKDYDTACRDYRTWRDEGQALPGADTVAAMLDWYLACIAPQRLKPRTLDAIMAWQPADTAPTPGPTLTREQWLLLVNQAQKAQRLGQLAIENVAQAAWYAKNVTQIINAAAQFDPERDAICRRIAHEDSRAAA